MITRANRVYKEAEEAGNVFSGFTEDDDVITDENSGGSGSDEEEGKDDDDGEGKGEEGKDNNGEGEEKKNKKDKGEEGEGEDNGDDDDKKEKDKEDDADDDEEGKNDDGEGEGEEGKDDDDEPELKIDDDEDGKEGEDKKSIEPVDFREDAKELGIELDEELYGDSVLTKEEFVEQVKDRIESAKQEFSYESIPEENRDVVKYFAEKGGNVVDLLKNDEIVLATSILNMNDRDKYILNKTNQLVSKGIARDEAQEHAQESFDELPEKDLALAIREIDQGLEAYKKSAINKAVVLQNEVADRAAKRENQKAQAERKKMVSVVNSMNQFMGMKLPDKVKSRIVEEIESGEMDKNLKKALAKAKVSSYLMQKFGKQIEDYQKKESKRRSANSYNKGVQKFIEKNHGKKPESRGKSANTGGEKPKWAELDEID